MKKIVDWVKSKVKPSIITLSPNDTNLVLQELNNTRSTQIADQMKQLQDSIYHLSNRIGQLEERVVELTTIMEIFEHDQEEEEIKLTDKWPHVSLDDKPIKPSRKVMN